MNIEIPGFEDQRFKDANEAYLAGVDLTHYLRKADSKSSQALLSMGDIQEQILNRLFNYNELTGIKSRNFPWFNKSLKGFRRGELTILTGNTGVGKTTFLSQYSLGFLMQHIPTLWGSFEIKNEIIGTTLLAQFSRDDLTKNVEKAKEWLEKLQQLPLYFMKYFGSTDPEDLFSTLDYAVYEHDVAHIVLDNLQFMLTNQNKSNFDKFEIQDRVIARLRQFASDRNVHVTLVIHPRKVEDNEELQISSVFGGGKATQEADNVLILQNLGKYRRVDVKKNRFDGAVARQCLGFDSGTKTYFHLSNAEVRLLESKETESMKDVKRRRVEAFGTIDPESAELEEKLGAAEPVNPLPNKEKKSARQIVNVWA